MNNILHFVPFKVQNKIIYLYFHIWTLLDYFAWFTCMKSNLGAAPCSSSVWNKLFQIPLSQLFFSWLKRAFIVFNYSYKKSQTQRALDLSILFIAGQSQQFDWQVQKVETVRLGPHTRPVMMLHRCSWMGLCSSSLKCRLLIASWYYKMKFVKLLCELDERINSGESAWTHSNLTKVSKSLLAFSWL